MPERVGNMRKQRGEKCDTFQDKRHAAPFNRTTYPTCATTTPTPPQHTTHRFRKTHFLRRPFPPPIHQVVPTKSLDNLHHRPTPHRNKQTTPTTPNMNRSQSTRELGHRYGKEHDTDELDRFATSFDAQPNQALTPAQQERVTTAVHNTKASSGTPSKSYIDRARQLEESATLSKMMKVTQPNPVKMFACGSEVVCMLLQTGELYIWCDDDPHPKLMNGYLSPHAHQSNKARVRAAQSGHISDDRRVYWTEQELRVRSKEELIALAQRLDVQLYSRDEILVRIKEKAEQDSTDPNLPKGDPSLLPSGN